MRLHSEGHRDTTAVLNETEIAFDREGNSTAEVDPEAIANHLVESPEFFWLVDEGGASLQADVGDEPEAEVVKRGPGRPKKAAKA